MTLVVHLHATMDGDAPATNLEGLLYPRPRGITVTVDGQQVSYAGCDGEAKDNELDMRLRYAAGPEMEVSQVEVRLGTASLTMVRA